MSEKDTVLRFQTQADKFIVKMETQCANRTNKYLHALTLCIYS